MRRVCFTLQVRPDRLDEYRRRHAEVWPDMLIALRDAGWHDYSLFLRDDGLLVGVFRTGDLDAALAALAATDARRIELKALDDKLLGEAVMLADGSGYLLESNLPTLGADRTYQVWAIVGDDRISLGILGRRPGVTAFKAAADVRALAVTDETAGGVISTEKPPVVLGWVPAAKPRSA